jgi:hypothetical protein
MRRFLQYVQKDNEKERRNKGRSKKVRNNMTSFIQVQKNYLKQIVTDFDFLGHIKQNKPNFKGGKLS